jgi:hypothetical protein
MKTTDIKEQVADSNSASNKFLFKSENNQPKNSIKIGENILLDGEHFYFNGEKVKDIHNVYELLSGYLTNRNNG